MMPSDGEGEGASEGLAGAMMNGLGRKRKAGRLAGDGGNLAVSKRVLRSDVAKQRNREAEEAKKKAFEEEVNGIRWVVIDEDVEVGRRRSLRSNSGRKRELKCSDKVAVSGCYQSNGNKEGVCDGNNKAESRSVSSSDVIQKSEEDRIHLKTSAGETVGSEDLGDLQEVISCIKDIECQKDSIPEVDVAKQRGNGVVTDKKDTDESNNLEKIFIQDAALGTDQNVSRCVIENSNSEQIKCEMGSTFSERNGTLEENFHELVRISCKSNMDVDYFGQRKLDDSTNKVASVEALSEISHKTTSVTSNRYNTACAVVENRRFTRSCTAKLKEHVNASLKESGQDNTDVKEPSANFTSGTVLNENNFGTCNQTGIKLEEDVGCLPTSQENIPGLKIEPEKKRAIKSDVTKQRDAESGMKRKKLESSSGKKGRRPPSDNDTGKRETRTDLLSCKRDQTDKIGEGHKLVMGLRKIRGARSKEAVPVKMQKVGLSDRSISKTRADSGLKDVKMEWSEDFEQMTLKQLKQANGCLVNFNMDFRKSQNKKVKVKGREQISSSVPTNDKILESEKSPLSEPKYVDVLCDMKNVMFEGEDAFSHQTKRGREVELSTAKKKLKNQIRDMLLNAGWKIDLRPRHGRNYKDTVYVEPNGCTHWSIIKAYYAFKNQFSCEPDGKCKQSEKSHRKSRKSSSSSVVSISEEALSILKHPISRRRSYKEIEEARMNLGDGSIGKKIMKHGKKYKRCQKKGGMNKGRSKKASALCAAKKKYQEKFKKKRKGCALLVRRFNQDAETGADVYVPYVWKRTTLSWMIDLGVLLENTAVNYMNARQTKILLKGQITRDGIRCSCCSKVLTVLDFGIHSGSKLIKPQQDIIIEEDGISLLQCQINAWEKQDESERRGFYPVVIDGDDPSDDTCGICGDGGDLICCDGCPSTFHQSCLGTKTLPPGDWYCMNCSCRYCTSSSANIPQGNHGTDSRLLCCFQCEEKYHQYCVPEKDAITTSTSQSCMPFCGQNCEKLSEELWKLLGVKNYLDSGYSWTVVQRFDEDFSESICSVDRRAECNSKIAVALAVMDECFLPIIDQRSGINVVHNVVYNCRSNFSRLNYSGFYTFILERDDEIISVASLRLHGTRVAEMPFIGTRNRYRRQGMCRMLLNEIESVLCFLRIEKLVIPAISELKNTWIKNFGFKLLEGSEKEEIRFINMLVFPGTGLLLKPLLEKNSADCETADTVGQFESEAAHRHAPEEANEKFFPADIELVPHASLDVIVENKYQINRLETSSFSDNCIQSEPIVATKSACAHVELLTPKINPSETSPPEGLSLPPLPVSLDDSVSKSEFQSGSSIMPDAEHIKEGTMDDGDSSAPNLLTAIDTSELVISEVNGM